MAINNMLVPVDASEGAKRALKLALEVAGSNPEVHIDIVHVVPIPLLDESQTISFKDILDMMIADGEDLLREAVGHMGEAAKHADTFILTGTNPATEIIKLIDERDYDLVVIGNRGLSGLKEYLGSVSHKVLHGSNVSVLIAK